MTVEEIFNVTTNHMLEGLMFHEQFMTYYDFLDLQGYRKCHKKHFEEETKNYFNLYHYYMKTYNMLLPNSKFNQPEVVPASWHQYTRHDVDMKTKQSAIKQGLAVWLKWETESLEMYENMYSELLSLNKIADAKEIEKIICDVHSEIQDIEHYQICNAATNYDMVRIMEEQ